jgi:hypothetical protein
MNSSALWVATRVAQRAHCYHFKANEQAKEKPLETGMKLSLFGLLVDHENARDVILRNVGLCRSCTWRCSPADQTLHILRCEK